MGLQDHVPVFEYPEGGMDVNAARSLMSIMLKASWLPPDQLQHFVHPDIMQRLLMEAGKLLKKEPTVIDVEVGPGKPLRNDGSTRVVVVGDTHGQYQDFCHMIELAGEPSEELVYVFNGDFIDRGAWGVELLACLAAWKLALPHHVVLLRGNHESSYCSGIYGFLGELTAKYPHHTQRIYGECRRLFAALPLAALVAGRTLVLHGGLFRKPPESLRTNKKGKRKKGRQEPWMPDPLYNELGTLEDLRQSRKGGQDPDGVGTSVVASDVLWSDPTPSEGFMGNNARGIGMLYGPDYTERFLAENGLGLILRSHEGPDARMNRDDGMEMMQDGYTVDHEGKTGRLVTVFSAPDYPQFQVDEERTHNRAAVALLKGPHWHEPSFMQFSAVPRPQAEPYYKLDEPDSDEDVDVEQFEPSEAGGSMHGDGGPDGPPEGDEEEGEEEEGGRDDDPDWNPDGGGDGPPGGPNEGGVGPSRAPNGGGAGPSGAADEEAMAAAEVAEMVGDVIVGPGGAQVRVTSVDPGRSPPLKRQECAAEEATQTGAAGEGRETSAAININTAMRGSEDAGEAIGTAPSDSSPMQQATGQLFNMGLSPTQDKRRRSAERWSDRKSLERTNGRAHPAEGRAAM
ncbi:unnamed protein product [Pedinophyceae sp. YPF-701]|nr:unnamed protein product [Pedinophyceae sp. YPF-701]